MMDDAELALLLVSGDPSAGPLFVSCVGPKLASYVDRVADDLMPADRDMIVEQTLATVARYIDQYDRDKASLATWSRRFVPGALRTWRRAHPAGPVRLDALADVAESAPEPPDPVTERRTTAIEYLLTDLPSTTQQIIQLHLGERLTFRQIAEVLVDSDPDSRPVSEDAVRKRYDRAINTLRGLAKEHPALRDLT
jgi:RNA polymerase sigma factor (sigma-70 family)